MGYRIMRMTAEMLPLVLMLLIIGIHSRPLKEGTLTTSTIPPLTPPLGCVENGKWHPPGSDISRGSDEKGRCYGTYCDDYGKTVAWDDWNCGPGPTKPPPTTPMGCIVDGISYPPGIDIRRGSDGKGWCYGTFCDDEGQTVAWDDWNCGTTKSSPSPETTLPPTTSTPPPPTTSTTPPPTTLPLGCIENGKWYPPGSDISQGSDGNWCYGTYCDDEGQTVAWDDWSCGTTTSTPSPTTTLPPISSTPVPPTTSTTPPPTTLPLGCIENGKWYPPGSDISKGSDGNWCYGTYCDDYGQILTWDNFNCGPSTTSTPTTITATTTTQSPTPP